jgi:hypothetical protein
MLPVLDALSLVPFVRNTVLGRLLSMAGAMTHLTIIQQGFDNWDISQRDPTIRSEQNLFGGSSLAGL